MRYLCLLALIASTLHAQDGAAIYKQKCASCHEAPAARVPSLSTIKKMSGEAIYMSLTRGVMSTRREPTGWVIMCPITWGTLWPRDW